MNHDEREICMTTGCPKRGSFCSFPYGRISTQIPSSTYPSSRPRSSRQRLRVASTRLPLMPDGPRILRRSEVGRASWNTGSDGALTS